MQNFEQLLNIIQSSKLADYHTTATTILNSIQYHDSTSDMFTFLLRQFLQGMPESKVKYFYILEQLVIFNSDNLKQNKLSLLLNLALSVSLNINVQQIQQMKIGLLLVNIHLKNLQKSGVFIPQIWRFLIQCFQKMSNATLKKYIRKQWTTLLSCKAIKQIDLLYVLIKITARLIKVNPINIQTSVIKQLLQSIQSKVNEQLLDSIISSLEQTKHANVSEYDDSVPFMIKQLTPRILVTEKSPKDQLNLLKKKRMQLKKRVIVDLRTRIYDRMQEQQIKDEVKKDKIKRRHKKELFMIEKQTAQAKKAHRMKKISKPKTNSKNKKSK